MFFWLLLLPLFVKAEYRVYQYLVKPSDGYSIKQTDPKIITSTFHPTAYKTYHGGQQDITLMRTWICPGYTGTYKKTCSHPWDQDRD